MFHWQKLCILATTLNHSLQSTSNGVKTEISLGLDWLQPSAHIQFITLILIAFFVRSLSGLGRTPSPNSSTTSKPTLKSGKARLDNSAAYSKTPCSCTTLPTRVRPTTSKMWHRNFYSSHRGKLTVRRKRKLLLEMCRFSREVALEQLRNSNMKLTIWARLQLLLSVKPSVKPHMPNAT